MDDILEDAKTYLRMVWQRRWLAFACAIVICLLGWIGVALLPNKYESKALLYIERTSLLQPLLKDLAAQSAAPDEMATMMRDALLVRPNLERLAQAAGIDQAKLTPVEFEYAIGKIKDSIDIYPSTDQRGVYNIVYQHPNPQIAHSVVRTTVDMFKETLAAAGQDDAEAAQRFIVNQLKEYEAKLQEAERRLKEFKQEHVGLMPEDGRSYYGRLEDLRNFYRNAVLDLKEAENSARSIRAQLDSFQTTSNNLMAADGGQDPVLDQLRAQQAQLALLKLKFTDKHPDVIAAKKLLDDLVAKISREARNPAPTSERNLNDREYNPAYQGVKLQLSKAEANVAALRTRVEEHKRRVDALEQNVLTMPQVEAELAGLNRDYAVQQDKYRKLAEGLEVAKLSDRAENVKVKVLEWPRVPITPVGPRRLLFNAAVLAIAVAFGIGLALALALTNPVIYTARALEKLTTFPVLGTVSFTATAAKRKPTKPFADISFFFAISVLLLFYVTLNAIYMLKVDALLTLAGFGFLG